jgi:hypothetical protein
MAAVSEGDREAGSGPVSGSRIHRLQPGVRPDLAAPVSLPDVLRGIASPSDAAAARQLEGSLQRRAADQQLRDELAVYDFSGPKYQRFEEELARYGTSVLRAWAYSGYIFKLVSSRGFTLYPSETELRDLHRDPEVREELANMTVAVALPRFRKRALIDGEWRYDGGASLPTFFMGACLYVFPNEFRRRRVQLEKWRRQNGRDPAVSMPEADSVSDPAVLATGKIHVLDHLSNIDPRARDIVALTLDQYSQDEIVELLGERSIRAVEGVLYRWRTQQKDRMQGGDGRDRRS